LKIESKNIRLKTFDLMVANTNDGLGNAPRLCCFMSELSLERHDHSGMARGRSTMESIKEAGYDGLQAGDHLRKRPCTPASGWACWLQETDASRTAEAIPSPRKCWTPASSAVTLHVGWG